MIMGLPPRGRGNPLRARLSGSSDGSTPAWAGQPNCCSSIPVPAKVYPRVGGATAQSLRLVAMYRGLPPRGRGNRGIGPAEHLSHGLPPRGRGNRHFLSFLDRLSRVYPRVGGATAFKSTVSRWTWRVYPRVGGATLHAIHRRRRYHRSTPAWAGQPGLRLPVRHVGRVYPRVGGATGPYQRRVRVRLGSTPAWAGQPPSTAAALSRSRVYPRVGGATSIEHRFVSILFGSTPAWAGQPGVQAQ